MLRKPTYPSASVATLRSSATMDGNIVLRALEDNQGLRIHVEPTNSDDPLSVTLNVFTAESLRAADVTSSLLSKSAVPRYPRRCTWPKLRQLREDLQEIVQTSSSVEQQHHCAKCQEMAEYLEYCFERPAMLARTWHGEVFLKSKVVEHFINTLVDFVGALRECVPSACDDCHRRVLGCVSSFLVPMSKWN